MALIIPHQSEAGIGVANGGGGAQYRGQHDFMTPGQAAMPGALNQLAQGMDKLGGAIFKMQVEKQDMQNKTDLLKDKIDYEDALRDFDSNYRENNRGASARNTVEDYDAFHRERLEKLQEKWGGNPYLMQSVDAMAESIRQPSMNHAVSYRDQQEAEERASVYAGAVSRFELKVNDPTLSLAEKAQALREITNDTYMMAGAKYEVVDGVGRWVGGKNIDAQKDKLALIYNTGQVESYIANGRLSEASKFLNTHKRDFGARTTLMYEAHIKSKQHEIEYNQKVAQEEALDAKFEKDWAAVKDLPDDEARLFFAQIADTSGDRQSRNKMLNLLEQELKVRKYKQDSKDAVIGNGLLKQAAKENWSEAQLSAYALSNGIKAGLSEQGVATLMKNAKTLDIDTAENSKAFCLGLEAIDNKAILNSQQAEEYAFLRGLNSKQRDSLVQYVQGGGKEGEAMAKYSVVKGLVTRYSDNKIKLEEHPEIYNWVVNHLPSTKVTDEVLRKTVVQAFETVNVPGTIFGTNEKSRYAADSSSILSTKIPDEERSRILRLFSAAGVTPTEFQIQEKYKEISMPQTVRGR